MWYCRYRLGAYGNDDGISTRICLRSGEINDDDILYPGKLMKEGETVNLRIHFAGDDSCYGALARSYCLVEEAAAKIVKIVDTVEPEPALVEKYEKRYQQFKQIYPTCKELFGKLK